MFKDYDKYLSQSLRVYLFVLIIIFIMKLVGLDYFGLDANNIFINNLNDFLIKTKLKNYICFIFLMIYQYLMMSIIMKDKSTKLKIFNIITFPATMMVQHYKTIYISNPIYYLIELLYLIIIFKIYNKNVKLKRILKVLLGTFVIQFISNFIRNENTIVYENDFIRNFILTLDYLFMLLIFQKVILEGGKICQICQVQVGSFSQMKINLRKLLTKLQENLHNFKKLDKVSKLTFMIYFILSLCWNLLTIIIVLLVARLNDTFIECIFILTSFWLSKRVFGKAFHLQSMTQCFIVSNLTYYFLNRITTPLGISILIPIMLGVGLSYFTSKLVKKTYKPLYKGMSKELFEETILKVVDKDSDKYKICYDYFINKKNALYLAGKYNYTEAGIRKIKDRVNNKIKELK